MNVLSLFDGMSCGQIALTELGCFPDKYYASEVDKFAIQQTMSVNGRSLLKCLAGSLSPTVGNISYTLSRRAL